MTISQVFGENVRNARKELGISQDVLAVKAGLHRTYIGAVERGERNITLVNAQKIALALEVKLTDLLRGL